MIHDNIYLQPLTATLRASLSESFEHLTLYQLRKFAQYFITELPRQVLPTAQRLLDELLNASSIINTTHGAPDPTAESSAGEQSCWCLDEDVLHENIRNLLVKFCIPTPLVCRLVSHWLNGFNGENLQFRIILSNRLCLYSCSVMTL